MSVALSASLVVAQAAYHSGKDLWQWRADFDSPAIVRVIKGDFVGVQHEAGHGDAEGAAGGNAAAFFELTAIHGVTQNGAANRRGVNANLARSAGFQGQLEVGCPWEAFDHFEVGDGRLAEAWVVNQGTAPIKAAADIAGEGVVVFAGLAEDEGGVTAAGAFAEKLRLEQVLRLPGSRHHQAAGCGHVDAVDHAEIREFRCPACARMHAGAPRHGRGPLPLRPVPTGCPPPYR